MMQRSQLEDPQVCPALLIPWTPMLVNASEHSTSTWPCCPAPFPSPPCFLPSRSVSVTALSRMPIDTTRTHSRPYFRKKNGNSRSHVGPLRVRHAVTNLTDARLYPR